MEFAKEYGYDFSFFVNVMLEKLLRPDSVMEQEELLREMVFKEVEKHSFEVSMDALQLRSKQAKKRKK